MFFSWYQGLSTLAAEHPKRFCSMSVTNPSRCQLSHCRTFSNLPQCSDIIIQFMSLRILEKQHVFQHRPKLWRWNRIHHLEKNMSNQIVIRQQHIRRLLMSNFQLHRNLMLIGKVANILTFLILCNDLTSIMFLCLKVLYFLKLKSLWEQRLTFFFCHGTKAHNLLTSPVTK